jgi:RNA polymerase sigma-70 factor (ECF subfamily)
MKWKPAHSQPLLSDEECIATYQQQSDIRALGILFDRYVELIFGVCLKYLKNPVESEDAAMEIFEVLAQKLKSHQVDSFRSWLYTLTKNHCLQILRKQRRSALTEVYEERHVHSEPIEHPEDGLALLIRENGLKDCMEKLPQAQKQSIELFYYESRSYQEIAELLIIDKEQVRSHIQNGRRNLRICIDQKDKKIPEK